MQHLILPGPLRIYSHNPHLRPPLVGGHVEHLAPLRELRLAVRREPDAARVPGHVAGVGSAELEGVPRLGRPGLHLSDDAPWQQHRPARPGVLLEVRFIKLILVSLFSYIFRLEGVEAVVCPEHEPPGDPGVLPRRPPLLLVEVALGEHLLGAVQLPPHAVPRPAPAQPRLGVRGHRHAQLQRLAAPLGHAHNLTEKIIFMLKYFQYLNIFYCLIIFDVETF